MRTFARTALLAVGLAVSLSGNAFSAGTGGCDSFAWPLTTELAWMKAADPEKLASGAAVQAIPGKAIDITLVPTAEAKLAAKPGGKPKNDPATSFAGTIDVSGSHAAGLYQVTLSSKGWIDIIQNGVVLESVNHTGMSDCEGIRKSVRFKIAEGPFTVQLSDVPSPSLKVIIRAAE